MTGLLVTVTSGVVLGLLTVLLRIEEARGSRLFLSRVRSLLDSAVLYCARLLQRIAKYVNIHIVRVSFHYIVHTILGALITLLHTVQGRLAHLQVRNRHSVKVVKESHKAQSHLEQLASFKQETALSEKEKSKRREH